MEVTKVVRVRRAHSRLFVAAAFDGLYVYTIESDGDIKLEQHFDAKWFGL